MHQRTSLRLQQKAIYEFRAVRVVYTNLIGFTHVSFPFLTVAIIAVLKANAYGHGSVELAKHLRDIGINHFAVASPTEGIELRKAGIESYIQVFGTAFLPA